MPPDSSDSVAADRRMDLASFFCLIARHGPAVVLAVIAGGFLLLVFILYRSVRERRRKATSTAAAERDGTDGSHGGETHEKRIRTEPRPREPERERGSAAESTDVNSDAWSNVEEESDRFVLRHRAAAAAAAEKKPPPPSPPPPPPQSDLSTTEHQKTPPEPVPPRSHGEESEPKPQPDSPQRRRDEDEVHVDDRKRKKKEVKKVKKEKVVKNETVTRDDDTERKSQRAGSRVDFNQTDDRDHRRVFTPEEQKTEQRETEKFVDQQLDQVSSSSQQDQCEPVTVCDTKQLLVDVNDHNVTIQTDPVEEKTTVNSLGAELRRILKSSEDSVEVEHLEVAQETSEVDGFSDLSVNLQSTDIDEKETSSSLEKDLPTSDLDLTSTEVELQYVDHEAALGNRTNLHVPSSSEDQPRGLMGNGEGAAPSVSVVVEAGCEERPEEHEEQQLLQVLQKPEACSSTPEEELHSPSTQQDQVTSPVWDDDGEEHGEEVTGKETSDRLERQVEPKVEKKEEEMTPTTTDPNTSYSTLSNVNQSRSVDREGQDKEIVASLDKDTKESTDADLDLPTSFEDQPTEQVVKDTVTQKTGRKNVSAASPGVISHPENLTLFQHPSVVTENLNRYQISPLEHVDVTDDVIDIASSPGVEVESGISSMTVSPDLPDAANDFGRIVEETVTEAPHNLYADDIGVSIFTEATAEMMFRHRDFTTFTVNEDVFGHQVEDRYHAALEEFMMQVTTKSLSSADESKTDLRGVVEVVEEKKKEVVRLTKKNEADAGNETEELYEKTEISIMEATMDNNEWITDANVHVHPWMNLSVQSFAQDITKADQLPADVDQLSSSRPGTDSGPSTEPKQTGAVPVVDENTEVNKKVLAVQPMPQNVNVTFRVHYLTDSLYQMVAVTGNQQELGNWKDYILLEEDKDGHWATVVSLPAESHVEWKFVVVDKGQVCRWEECRNRLLYTGYGDDLTVHKLWGLL